MLQVYVVTDGDYSDYRILGIYSSEAHAVHARAVYAAGNEIEEYVLDAIPSSPPGLFAYGIAMDADGNGNPRWGKAIQRLSNDNFTPDVHPYGDDKHVYFKVWATDPTHALKIANEMRVQRIADGSWTVK